MAAYGTANVHYTKPYNAVLSSNPGFTALLARPDLGVNGDEAAISVLITTAVTLQTLTDGTMLANNAAQTIVALTLFDGVHTLSLKIGQLGTWTPEKDAAEFLAFADAAEAKAQLEVMTDLEAGAAGLTVTLPTGQVDFTTDGTVAEQWLALNALDQAVSFVESQTQGKSTGSIFIIMPRAGHANIRTTLGTTEGARFLTESGGFMFFRGHPIFLFNQTLSGWAGAGDVAAFVVHTDAEALTFTRTHIPHAGLEHYSDGFYKKFWQTFGYAGLIQASHFAEVDNPAS